MQSDIDDQRSHGEKEGCFVYHPIRDHPMLKLMIPNRMRANVEGKNSTRDNLSEGRACLYLFRVGAQRKRVDVWRKENVDCIVITSCPPRVSCLHIASFL